MDQPTFIYTARHLGLSPVQDSNGGVILELGSQVQLVHRCRKNKMILIFVEDGVKFTIPSKDKLEEIYRIHLVQARVESASSLRKWCDENLEELLTTKRSKR